MWKLLNIYKGSRIINQDKKTTKLTYMNNKWWIRGSSLKFSHMTYGIVQFSLFQSLRYCWATLSKLPRFIWVPQTTVDASFIRLKKEQPPLLIVVYWSVILSSGRTKRNVFLYHWIGRYLWIPRERRGKKIVKKSKKNVKYLMKRKKVERKCWGYPPFFIYK